MAESPADRPSLQELAALSRDIRVCPDCGCRDFRVTNTWHNKDGTIRRLRKCRHCGRPVHSSETVDET